MRAKPLRLIPHDGTMTMGEHRRYPGCRLAIVCGLCGWSKGYSPERVLVRLRATRSGGHGTRLPQVAERVQWPCPGCGHLRWRAQFAWPANLSEGEAKRLAGLYRN